MAAYPFNEILLNKEKEQTTVYHCIWCYITNHLKIQWLKTTTVYYLSHFRGLREWHFYWPCLGWLLHLYSAVAWPGLESQESLTHVLGPWCWWWSGHLPPCGPLIQVVFPSSRASVSLHAVCVFSRTAWTSLFDCWFPRHKVEALSSLKA